MTTPTMDCRIVHVVSVSGGKDSLATLLIAIARFGVRRIVAIFCDTGNEHEDTYAYLDYLEQRLGLTIHRLRADFSERIAAKRLFIARDQRKGRDATGRRVRWTNKAKRRALEHLHPTGNPFLDLCMWKGRFPSRKAQFCTEELKRNIAVEFQMELMEAGHTVVSWQGVRRDESLNRRNAKKFERVAPGLFIFRPLVDWTALDCFALATAHDVASNPLYKKGMGRVGCMPCINVRKDELRQIAMRFGHHLVRISEWEFKVGMCCKRGFSTFLADSHGAVDRREVFADLNIWARVEWSHTTRGGQQFDLLRVLDEPTACSSSYALCE